MAKSKDEHLISAETEKLLIDVGVDSGLLLVATSSCAQIASSKKEKQALRENLKVVSAVSTSETKEELLEAFASIDWSKADQAPSLVAISMNPDAIRHAPIDWANIEMRPMSKEVEMHQPVKVPQDISWLSRKTMGYGNNWYEHLRHHSRYSDKVVRSQQLFWKTLVDEGKINGNTSISSTMLGEKEKTKLFDVALARAPEEICKILLPSTTWTQEEAEKSLACWAVANRGIVSFHQHKETFVSKVLTRMFAAKPDALSAVKMDFGVMYEDPYMKHARYWSLDIFNHQEAQKTWPLGYICFVSFHEEVFDTRQPWGAKMGAWLMDYFQKENPANLEKMMAFWAKQMPAEIRPSTEQLLASMPASVRQVIFDIQWNNICKSSRFHSCLDELHVMNVAPFEGFLVQEHFLKLVEVVCGEDNPTTLKFEKIEKLCSEDMKEKVKDLIRVASEKSDEKRELSLSVFRQEVELSLSRPKTSKKKM